MPAGHQLNVLQRKAPKRLAFNAFDRLVIPSLYRIAPNILNALVIVKPDTVVRWRRSGFRLFWRWKSRRRGGRPTVPLEIRQLIREMSLANPLWPAVGCSPDRWRTPQAWHRHWSDLGRQKYGKTQKTPHPKDGRRLFATTPMGSPQWISSSFRHSPFGCFTACSFYATADAKSYGWA